MTWDPSKHARAPAGAAGGGRFITGQSNPQQDDAAKGAKKKLGKLDAAHIRAFQRQHGLVVDGVIGRQTAKALLGDFHGAKSSRTGKLTHEQTRRLSMMGGAKTQPSGAGTHVRIHRTEPASPTISHPSQPRQAKQPKQRKVSVNGVHAGFISLHPHTGPHGSEMNFLAHDHTGEVMGSHTSAKKAASHVAANHFAMGQPGAVTTHVAAGLAKSVGVTQPTSSTQKRRRNTVTRNPLTPWQRP